MTASEHKLADSGCSRAQGLAYLREADPVIAQLIDSHLGRIVERFDGPPPAPLSGRGGPGRASARRAESRRKVQTLRALAKRFDDGRLSIEELQALPDEEVEAADRGARRRPVDRTASTSYLFASAFEPQAGSIKP